MKGRIDGVAKFYGNSNDTFYQMLDEYFVVLDSRSRQEDESFTGIRDPLSVGQLRYSGRSGWMLT